MIKPKTSLFRLASLVALLLFVVVRYLVLVHFNWEFLDSDQAINWLTATDMANGQFYSPFFYGQFYNNVLEAFVSAPFIALGFNVQDVVPLVSNCIGASPFVLAFVLFYRKKRYEFALVVMVIGLCMPSEYHLISSMARGFMGGLCILMLGIVLTTSYKKYLQGIGYFLCLVSVLVNPNAIVVLLPIAAYWLATRYKNIRKKPRTVVVAVCAFTVTYMALYLFKVNHSMYSVHQLWSITFHSDFFIHAIKNGDSRLAYLMPLLPKQGGILLFALPAICLLFFWRNKRSVAAWVVFISVLFFVFTLFVNKTMDGTTSVFFPYSRMYLGMPMLYVLFYALWRQNKTTNMRTLVILAVFALMGFTNHMKRVSETSLTAVRKNTGQVQALRISALCLACDELEKLANKVESDLIVFHSKADEYTYGCQALNPSLKTLYPQYDRRAWVFSQHAFNVHQRVLFLDWELNFGKQLINYNGQLTQLEHVPFPAYLLENNDLPIFELYIANNLPVRLAENVK